MGGSFQKVKALQKMVSGEDETAIPGGRRRFSGAERLRYQQFRVLSAILELTAKRYESLLLLLLMPPGLGLLLCLCFLRLLIHLRRQKDTMSFVLPYPAVLPGRIV